METIKNTVAWVLQRPRRLWHFGAAVTAALLLESFVGLEERETLAGLMILFLMLGAPYERLPFTWARMFGVQVRFGIVETDDGGPNDDPNNWKINHFRLNRIGTLTFPGEVAHHVVEVPAEYRILFLDDNGTLQMWTEQELTAGKNHFRRYSTFAFGNYQSVPGQGTIAVPLHVLLVLKRSTIH